MAIADSYKYWIDNIIDRSRETKRAYQIYFKDFMEWSHKSANELYELKRDGSKAQNPRESFLVESLVVNFLEHLKTIGKTPATRRLALCAIYSFFNVNRCALDKLSIKIPEGASEGSKIPSKAEIKTMLQYAKSKVSRAIILMLKDSGLRQSDLANLKWSNMIDYGAGFWGFKPLVTEKKGVLAYPFLGPESTQAILALPRNKDKIISSSARTIKNHMYEVTKESKVSNLTGHGLRKFFICELRSARVPQDLIYVLCGKSTKDNRAYSEVRPEKLLEAYRQAYSSLEVYQESSERLNKIEKENLDLKATIEGLRQKLELVVSVTRDLASSRNELLKDPDVVALLEKKQNDKA